MCTKKISGILRAVSGSPHPKNFTPAIIAAAGMSVRFGTESTKQMTHLCGVPLLVHTLRAFEETECIHEIILVARKAEIPYWEDICRDYEITKVAKIIPGGYSRQESVLNGLDAVSEKSKFVAISDGARCLVTPENITRVCRNAYLHGAATAATPATDTVKIADKHAFVVSTTERKNTWLATTPQVFRTNLYRAAAYTALTESFEGTDDNSLVEHIEYPVKLVDCGRENIKITTPADLYLAEAILRYRRDTHAYRKENGEETGEKSESKENTET